LRLLKYAVIVMLSNRVLYGLFVWLCQVRHRDHDQVLSAAVRGFAGGDFASKIRRQPSWPLLRLLRRRIAQGEQPSAAQRTAIALLAQRIPGAVGMEAEYHSHWVCPLRHPQADALIQHLLQQGFDATRGASSMGVVAPPAGRARALEAEQLFAEMLYLPMHEGMSANDAERLIHEIEWFNQSMVSQRLLSA
jgi:dTDP-4-amino-4,6-dideoxygalactose transaminase